MKKLFVTIAVLSLMLVGCGETPDSTESQPSTSETSVESASGSSADESESSVSAEEPESTELPELSEDIAQMMLDNFGGAGNPEYATSWYPYIDTITAYQDGEAYKVNVTLTEAPADTLLRSFTASYQSYFGDVYDDFMSILVNAQAALSLEDVDACLIADDIYNILTKESDVSVYYASLNDLGVNAYRYISEATGGEYSEAFVQETASTLYGPDFAGAILAGMETEFADASSAPVLSNISIIANTIKSSYTDVSISQVDLLDPSGNIVYTAE